MGRLKLEKNYQAGDDNTRSQCWKGEAKKSRPRHETGINRPGTPDLSSNEVKKNIVKTKWVDYNLTKKLKNHWMRQANNTYEWTTRVGEAAVTISPQKEAKPEVRSHQRHDTRSPRVNTWSSGTTRGPRKLFHKKSVLTSGTTRGPRELIHDAAARHEVPTSFHQRQDQRSVLPAS